MKFNDVWQVVEPKRKARDQANEELNAARNKLTELRNMIIVKYKTATRIFRNIFLVWCMIFLGIGKKTKSFNRRI